MAGSGTIRIGISGWRYAPWRGEFYPKGLRQKDELAYAADKFRTIEINGTFYATQRPASFDNWRESAPGDFVFSVKAPRFITHTRRLRDVEVPLANFFASGVLRLGAKLGPFLWQFPPSMKFDPEIFRAFFDMLPHDTQHAMKQAKRNDKKKKEHDYAPASHHPLRHAVEIRHESFCTPEFIALLRQSNIALVCADAVKWPRMMDITGDFLYCRLHGSEELYASGYDDKALEEWHKRIESWAQGRTPRDSTLVPGVPHAENAARDVFLYFDNDMKRRAPADAGRLEAMLA